MARQMSNGKKADPRLRKLEPRIQKSVMLPESLWREVKARSIEWSVPMAALIEQAIRDYLEKNHS